MTDRIERQRAIASLAKVRRYNSDVIAEAFTCRILRSAIADAVGADVSVSRFKKDDLRTLADHFDIEYDRTTKGRDLQRRIGTKCNFDYDEFESDTFTKPQLAKIATRLAKDGAFQTERKNNIASVEGRSRWKSTVSTAIRIVGPALISLYIFIIVAENVLTTLDGEEIDVLLNSTAASSVSVWPVVIWVTVMAAVVFAALKWAPGMAGRRWSA